MLGLPSTYQRLPGLLADLGVFEHGGTHYRAELLEIRSTTPEQRPVPGLRHGRATCGTIVTSVVDNTPFARFAKIVPREAPDPPLATPHLSKAPVTYSAGRQDFLSSAHGAGVNRAVGTDVAKETSA